MLRAVLCSVIAFGAAAACKGGDPGSGPVAGAPAGKVLSVGGAVNAVRDGKSRALAVGDTVSGDDRIDTGADGHVAIRLDRNGAVWELGASKKQRVSDSLAWTLPQAEGSAAVVDQATSAAGRHGERSAADTEATAAAAPRAAMPEAAQAPTTPTVQAAPAPAPAPAESNSDSLGLKGTGEGGGGAGEGIGIGNVKRGAAPKAARAPSAEIIRQLLERDRAKLRACLDASAPHLTLTLRASHGPARIELSGGAPSEKVRACLENVVKPYALDTVERDGSIELEK